MLQEENEPLPMPKWNMLAQMHSGYEDKQKARQKIPEIIRLR